MAHAAPGRRGDAGDEADYRFLYVFLNELRRFFLGIAADFADHHNRLGFRILLEQRKDIDESCAVHRIATDAYAGCFPQPQIRELMHGLVREGAAAGDDAHDALLVDESRHDADLGFLDRDHTRAVRADQPNVAAAQRALDLDHVVDRNAFGDADDQLDAGIGSFKNRVGAKRWRHEDQGGVAFSLFDGIGHRIEDGDAFHFLAGLSRSDARDDLRSIGLALGRMEGAFLARNPLHHHTRVLIDENAHD